MVSFCGKTIYEDSIIVGCDCGGHIMEIYKHKSYDKTISYGIVWHGIPLKKSMYGFNFYFDGIDEFDAFVDTLQEIQNNTINGDGTIIRLFDEGYTNSKGKFVDRGFLDVVIDDCGYVSFYRYEKCKPKSKNIDKHLLWDLCIKKEQLGDLVKKLNKMR